MTKNVAIAVTAVLGVALALAGCGSGGASSGSGTSPQVHLGALLPQTGDLAALGGSTLEATKLAVKVANDSGKVNVKLSSQDSATNPSVAQTAIQALIGEGVKGIVGDVSSSVCLSVVDAAAQAKVPMMAPACTTPQLSTYDDHGYFFRTAASSAEQGRALAHLVRDDGHTTAAILGVNDNYGQPIVSTFVDTFAKLGGKVETNIRYDPTARTFAAETQQLSASNAGAIVLIGLENTGAAIIHDAAQRGLLKRQWYMGDGIRSADFPKRALPDDPQALYAWKGIGTGSPAGPGNDAFKKAYQSNLGKAPGSFAAQAYDAAWILMLAGVVANKDGSHLVDDIPAVTDPNGTKCIATDCLGLVASGKHVAYDGATGTVTFDKNGDPVRPVYEVWQFSAQGLTTLKTMVGGQ